MEKEILDLNTLFNLGKRVLRGAKPGSLNSVNSGVLYVETVSISQGDPNNPDNRVLPPSEYLLQPSLAATVFTDTDGVFTVGSRVVRGTRFFRYAIGDIIRFDDAEKFYIITAVVDDLELRIGDPFTASGVNSGESVTGNYTVKKVKFTNAFYEYFKNTSPDLEEFSYDQAKVEWVLQDGADPKGPLPTNSTEFVDDISIQFIGNGEDGVPDFQTVGSVVGKFLPTVQTESLSVDMAPVPFPGDHSTLVVRRKKSEEDDYSLLSYNVDYVVNYSISPVYEFPLRPFKQRTRASLMFLDLVEADPLDSTVVGAVLPSMLLTIIDRRFPGQIQVIENKEQISDLLTGTEVVKLVDPDTGKDIRTLEINKDYLLSAQSGVVTFINTNLNEELIEVIIHDTDLVDNGVVITSGTGSLDNPDFTDGRTLIFGADYSYNRGSGLFRIFEGINPEEVLKAEYFVQGQSIKDTAGVELDPLLGEDVTSLRTSRFPIMVGSVALTSVTTKGVRKILVEDRDYTLSMKTGIIELLADIDDFGKLYMDYTPLSPVTCLIKANPDNPSTYNIRILGDYAVALSDEKVSYLLANPDVAKKDSKGQTVEGSSINGEGLVSLVTRSGSFLDITGYTYAEDDKLIQLSVIPTDNIKQGDYLYATYDYVAENLPYPAIQPIDYSYPEGGNSFLVENRDVQDLLPEGTLLKLTAFDTKNEYLLEVKSTSYDEVNTTVVLMGIFPASIRNPTFQMTDSSVSFTPLQVGGTQLVAAPIGERSTAIAIQGDATSIVKVGKVLKFGNILFSVTGVVYSEDTDSTSVSIATPAPRDISGNSVLSSGEVSTKILYTEGDNTLLSDSTILGVPQPAFTIKHRHASDPSAIESNSATVLIDKTQIVLKETINENSSVIEPISYLELGNIEEIVAAIEAINTVDTGNGTQAFEVEWILPDNTDVRSQYLSITEPGFTPDLSLPYNTKVTTQLLKKVGGSTVYEPLAGKSVESAGEFDISPGVFVLTEPLVRGDRFKATYQGVELFSGNRGDGINIQVRHFVPAEKGTNITITTDYLKPDQYFLQGMLESDFMTLIGFPALVEIQSNRKGASPAGVEENPPADQGNAAGGVGSNVYLLRDEVIKKEIYKKSYEYYTGRMSFFANEYEAIVGFRLGNNDFDLPESDIRYNLSTDVDIDNSVALTYSKLFPVGHKFVTPKRDGRFEGQYISYGESNFFNFNGVGQAYGDNPEWLLRVSVGDQIRILGTAPNYYTVAEVFDTRLVFTEPFIKKNGDPWKNRSEGSGPLDLGEYRLIGNELFQEAVFEFPSWDLKEYKDVSKTGYQYEVKLQSRPPYPIFDDRGFLGANAIGSLDGDFEFPDDTTWDSIFEIEVSDDQGATWFARTIDMTKMDDGGFFSFSNFYSIETVADYLLHGNTSEGIQGLSDILKVSVEKVYDSEVDTSVYTDISWPLEEPPDLDEDEDGVRRGIVIRGIVAGRWIRFPENNGAASRVLGFPRGNQDTNGDPEGIWFRGAYIADNAKENSQAEINTRAEQSTLLDTMIALGNKFDRFGSTYRDPYEDLLDRLIQQIIAPRENIEKALIEVSKTLIEDTASDAIAQSFGEATAAKDFYTDLLSFISIAEEQNRLLIERSAVYESFIITYDRTTMLRDDIATELKSTHASPTNTKVTFVAGGDDVYDPRILTGDGTVNANINLDGTSRFLFPQYVNNSNIRGSYTKVPQGSWETISVRQDPLRIQANTGGNFWYKISNESITLKYYIAAGTGINTIELSFTLYPTIGNLLQGINRGSNGNLIGTVVYGNNLFPIGQERTISANTSCSDLVTNTTLTNSFSLARNFPVEQPPYTQTSSVAFLMDQAFTLAASGTAEYTITEDSLVLSSPASATPGNPSGIWNVEFTAYPLVGGIVQAINDIPSFSATIVDSALSSYNYGALTEMDTAPLPTIPQSVYFGAKGDIEFKQMSELNIIDIKEYNAQRAAELNNSIAFYTGRASQISASVSRDGENLSDHRNLWLGRLVDKEVGPCTRILALKRQIIKGEEETDV